MGKKNGIPPGVLDEIITRLEQVEERVAAIEGAINAFVVVFGIRRLPDDPGDDT